MAPSGDAGASNPMPHGSPVLLQDDNFPTWKHAFTMAAKAHGWWPYYTSPSFEDPRVLTQTMAALHVAMDADLLQQPRLHHLHPTAPKVGDVALGDWTLKEDLRLDALRQHKFLELHALFASEFQAQARLYLSSSLSPPLQLAVQAIECPYRMYSFLQDRFEHAAMDALDLLRLVLAPYTFDGLDKRVLCVHFDRIDTLMARFQSKIRPAGWAAMSTADYDLQLWDALRAVFLRHSLMDVTVDKLHPASSMSQREGASAVDNIKRHLRRQVTCSPPMPLTSIRGSSPPLVPNADEPFEVFTQLGTQTSLNGQNTDPPSADQPSPSIILAEGPTSEPRQPSTAPPAVEINPRASKSDEESIHVSPPTLLPPTLPPSAKQEALPDDSNRELPRPTTSIAKPRNEPDAPAADDPSVAPNGEGNHKAGLVEEGSLNRQAQPPPGTTHPNVSDVACAGGASASTGADAAPDCTSGYDDKTSKPHHHHSHHGHRHRHRKPPAVVDTWAIPKKPKPTTTPPTEKSEDIPSPPRPPHAELVRRGSTSNLSSSDPVVPPTLSRRASTSNIDTAPPFDERDAPHNADQSQPPLKRRRKEYESKLSRWAPKPPAPRPPTRSIEGANDLVQTGDSSGPRALVMDLSRCAVDPATISRCVYISHLSSTVTEAVLAHLCRPFRLQIDPTTSFPRIDVFMCQRTLRPRGDAAVYLAAPDDVPRLVTALHEIREGCTQCALTARAMDEPTFRVLKAQVYDDRPTWTCVQCRTHVPRWRSQCAACKTNRAFPAENSHISPSDWVCVLCLTANDEAAAACRGCHLTQ